jgi:hypothetical protein
LEQGSLSVDAYMKRKWGDSLRNLGASFMIHIEKSTGRLVGFLRNESEKEVAPPSLSRKQCWEKAEQFLQQVFPDYTSYLQLEVDKEDTDEEPRKREFFYLPLYISGIPVNHERVTLSVNTSTGEICIYMGVSYQKICELVESHFCPAIPPEEALNQFVAYVNVKLKWFKEMDVEPQAYRLVYELTTTRDGLQRGTGRNRVLRYIDAYNGEPIWEI